MQPGKITLIFMNIIFYRKMSLFQAKSRPTTVPHAATLFWGRLERGYPGSGTLAAILKKLSTLILSCIDM